MSPVSPGAPTPSRSRVLRLQPTGIGWGPSGTGSPLTALSLLRLSPAAGSDIPSGNFQRGHDEDLPSRHLKWSRPVSVVRLSRGQNSPGDGRTAHSVGMNDCAARQTNQSPFEVSSIARCEVLGIPFQSNLTIGRPGCCSETWQLTAVVC